MFCVELLHPLFQQDYALPAHCQNVSGAPRTGRVFLSLAGYHIQLKCHQLNTVGILQVGLSATTFQFPRIFCQFHVLMMEKWDITMDNLELSLCRWCIALSKALFGLTQLKFVNLYPIVFFLQLLQGFYFECCFLIFVAQNVINKWENSLSLLMFSMCDVSLPTIHF